MVSNKSTNVYKNVYNQDGVSIASYSKNIVVDFKIFFLLIVFHFECEVHLRDSLHKP